VVAHHLTVLLTKVKVKLKGVDLLTERITNIIERKLLA
jgi:hypothetical protein